MGRIARVMADGCPTTSCSAATAAAIFTEIQDRSIVRHSEGAERIDHGIRYECLVRSEFMPPN